MGTYNLFSLISDKLLLNSNDFSMSLYNTLYEVYFIKFLFEYFLYLFENYK
jgi:hypothetical protein